MFGYEVRRRLRVPALFFTILFFWSSTFAEATAYAAAMNVTSRTDNDGSVTSFGYDGANQITSESRSTPSSYAITYSYDHNGNRLTKVLGGVTENYSYDYHDKLQSAGSKSYAYDSNGNCTSVTNSGATTSLTYDYENRITGITYPGGATNSFQYSGLGLRTRRVDSAGTFNYVCDGSQPASPVLADSAATYTSGASERRGSTSSFYHGDGLTSTRGITNSAQSATDGILYDAFGMTVSRTGTNPTPFGFAGGFQYQSDKDSGLMLLGRRYYDPSIGRFITQDPIHDGNNWYAYCANNPLIAVDPTGEILIPVIWGAVALVGITVTWWNIAHGCPPDEAAMRGIGAALITGAVLTGAWGIVAARTAAAEAATAAGIVGAQQQAQRITSMGIQWAPRVLQRAIEDPGPMHNFPVMFDADIITQGTQTISTPTFIQFEQSGFINDIAGNFEIGGIPNAAGNLIEITHRFFRKLPGT